MIIQLKQSKKFMILNRRYFLYLKLPIFFFTSLTTFGQILIAQTNDIVVNGKKAHYSVLIPEGFIARQAKGANVDLKYVNNQGCSIVTVVLDQSKEVFDQEIMQSDFETKNDLELNGLENVTIIKRGARIVDGVETYICIFDANNLHNYSVTKYIGKRVVNLNIGIPIRLKNLYKPDIFKVSNSFKVFK